MKNCIGKVWHDNPLAVLMKLFMFTAVLGWVLSTTPVVGHAAASKSQAPNTVANSQAKNANSQNAMFDTSAVPQKHSKEWAGIQNKLVKEYTACTDDCGSHLECQERCWNVYEFRLDREHKRIMHTVQ